MKKIKHVSNGYNRLSVWGAILSHNIIIFPVISVDQLAARKVTRIDQLEAGKNMWDDK